MTTIEMIKAINNSNSLFAKELQGFPVEYEDDEYEYDSFNSDVSLIRKGIDVMDLPPVSIYESVPILDWVESHNLGINLSESEKDEISKCLSFTVNDVYYTCQNVCYFDSLEECIESLIVLPDDYMRAFLICDWSNEYLDRTYIAIKMYNKISIIPLDNRIDITIDGHEIIID